MAFWCYILLCADGRYCTGHTDDLDKRIGQHQTGTLEGFTASRRPVRLMWSQDFPTRYEALDAELKIKKWSQAKKEALIRGDWAMVSHFAKPPKKRPALESVGVERSRDTPNPKPGRVERSRDIPNPKPVGVERSRDIPNPKPVRVERSRDIPNPKPVRVERSRDIPNPKPVRVERSRDIPNPKPVRVERSRDTPKDDATPTAPSNPERAEGLEANGSKG